MALIVEDGTGLSTAESFISVADAVTYHTNRGNTSWNDVVELMTLDVAPGGAGWAIGDTITGATSAKTCVIVQRITSLTYYVNQRSGTFTLGEILSNGTATADQGAANPTFAASDAIREQCLRKATEYMEQVYRYRWQGERVLTTQALSWPRNCVEIDGITVVSGEIVPEEVERACAELALEALSGELAPNLTQNVTNKTVGPISITYDTHSPQQKRFRRIDNMLAPYLTRNSSISFPLGRV